MTVPSGIWLVGRDARSASPILTLDELNRVLAAWLEVAYHQEVHGETGQTPHARYHQEPRLLRQVDLGAALTFFHLRLVRTVDQDFPYGTSRAFVSKTTTQSCRTSSRD